VRRTLAVVGASLAGARVVEGAREAGFDGRIVLIGDEATPPYERPPLSKAVLRGEASPDTARVHPDDFYRDHDIEVVTERVADLDPVARDLELANGDRIPFDTVVLATGASPRRLAVAGAGLAGVHHLRTIDDAVRLRDAVRGASRVVVIGAGWIGSEVAASARQMGADVVLVDPAAVPLQRVLGRTVGAAFRDLHADHGVELRLGTGVAALRGTKAVEAVILDDGRVEAADVVVAGIGVTPCTELADAQPALRVDNGVLVDQFLEASVTGVFAAGDVANAWHPHYQRHVRVEHWANALNQGITAGHNAAGNREPYSRLPYFFSDQYDLGMEYVGYGAPDDIVTIRGDLAKRAFIAFWQRDGVVTAAMSVNIWDVAEVLEQVVRAATPVDSTRLADPDVPLGDLVPKDLVPPTR
jgi:3-phenylpropionate/trans-cinnamate dioxygenase ferredoxin reductase component